jgi:hypothetical protein
MRVMTFLPLHARRLAADVPAGRFRFADWAAR